MPIPIVFRKSAAPLVSYDWIDIMRDVGYIRYYACASWDDSGTYYFLTTEVKTSQPRLTTGAAKDIDFDYEFKIPVTIKNDYAIINVSNGQPTGAALNYFVKVFHVAGVGGAETQINATVEITRAAVVEYHRDCIQTLLTKKYFKAGDKLRVNVSTHAASGAGSYFCHDPISGLTLTDVDTVTITTDLTCDIPFEVQF